MLENGVLKKVFGTRRENETEGREKTLNLTAGRKEPLGRPRRRRQEESKTDSVMTSRSLSPLSKKLYKKREIQCESLLKASD